MPLVQGPPDMYLSMIFLYGLSQEKESPVDAKQETDYPVLVVLVYSTMPVCWSNAKCQVRVFRDVAFVNTSTYWHPSCPCLIP